MLAFLKLINLTLCHIAMQLEWDDAYEAYTECLQTSLGTAGDHECFDRLIQAIGESAVEFTSCLF